MFEILSVVVFCMLLIPALRLCFKLAWGAAKVFAVILLVLSLPSMIGCLLMASGIVLLMPVALIALAWGILRACI